MEGHRATVYIFCEFCRKHQHATAFELLNERDLSDNRRGGKCAFCKEAEWRREVDEKRRFRATPEWREIQKAKRTAQSNKYRAAKLQAMPAWADKDQILAVYRNARDATTRTGIQHHVDHIVPLNGKGVCGLHIHINLQVLIAAENMSKGNRMVEDEDFSLVLPTI